VEEQKPPPLHSSRMKIKPPLPPEATTNCRPRHRRTQTTESGTSGSTSGPPLDIDHPESSIPLSSKPEITFIPVGDTDTIETKVPEFLLHEVIQSNLPHPETLFPDVIEPEDP